MEVGVKRSIFDIEKVNFIDEILLIDKPLRWTSFDVVAKIRNVSGIKKVGHCGTLDPLATGLLIVCTGKKTKAISGIQDGDKVYEFEFHLGASTATYDSEILPTEFCDISSITKEMIIEKSKQFIGEIEQTPPVYSAKKIGGKRAYALARKGIEVVLKPSKVRVEKFEIAEYIDGKVRGVIHCGKGTYIRSLANDLGVALGVGAYLSGLRRTQIGTYNIENSLKMIKE